MLNLIYIWFKRHSVDKSISWKSMNWHFTFMTAALSRIPGGYVFSNDNDKNFLKNIEFDKTFFATNVEAHFDQWSEQKKFYIAYIYLYFKVERHAEYVIIICLFTVFEWKSAYCFLAQLSLKNLMWLKKLIFL